MAALALPTPARNPTAEQVRPNATRSLGSLRGTTARGLPVECRPLAPRRTLPAHPFGFVSTDRLGVAEDVGRPEEVRFGSELRTSGREPAAPVGGGGRGIHRDQCSCPSGSSLPATSASAGNGPTTLRGGTTDGISTTLVTPREVGRATPRGSIEAGGRAIGPSPAPDHSASSALAATLRHQQQPRAGTLGQGREEEQTCVSVG